ncbi:hypothetical protein A2533_00570 [Candidatus Falkowbacteria bacterium RIFOXYD2_FULL_35_9]|uniref:Uncharacterized protein n=1 Tax=Candidatus Falkowbacteria bacterium RIFOXYC2_FULL_36_12 TaxID=1798002 RepID=A0A1F5T042_9BACT|nr:MAG: hypothetical protein A2300_04190 [Candidatus Falkowbacteria bacterium RIFOXYB2_FULL_35_7]OGF32289.1 MAG: hypothetical protein A2478_03105 [Candidatus Falkowbacteria bacterium RIFOXYC2_FULL_36_12]OGF34147.1 MAG: hypothetical protein A2223_00490 [Candidatus Falkowbacteria bacterium RIFOXYA2_FULL_35_8]OGF46658.1 MAG: hypothetical protein A2533_00570 [Candidatus Falkowbacteria bacterium RIFOXYD2_FULL_35_9]
MLKNRIDGFEDTAFVSGEFTRLAVVQVIQECQRCVRVDWLKPEKLGADLADLVILKQIFQGDLVLLVFLTEEIFVFRVQFESGDIFAGLENAIFVNIGTIVIIGFVRSM